MKSKLLQVFLTSALVATSAAIFPGVSLADEAQTVDPAKATVESTQETEEVTATADDANANTNTEESEDIQTRGSRSHRRYRPNTQLNRPPSADDVNNAGNKSRSGNWWWF